MSHSKGDSEFSLPSLFCLSVPSTDQICFIQSTGSNANLTDTPTNNVLPAIRVP